MLGRSMAMGIHFARCRRTSIASLGFLQLLGLAMYLLAVEAAPLWTMFYPAEPATTFPEEDADLKCVGGCGGAHPSRVEHGSELLGFRNRRARY